jgi:hypothetical protein
VPEKKTIERARRDKRQGKSPSTQAGEFVREEIEHVREGKHGARSSEQAIAIGLSKARRSGVKLPPPRRGKAATKKQAARDLAKGEKGTRKTSAKRARATRKALKGAGRKAATRKALAQHARKAARKRSATERSRAAKKAARTKGPVVRRRAAKKAARTRARRAR